MVRERSPSKTTSSNQQHLSPPKTERRPLANISAKMQSPSPKQAKDGEGGDKVKTSTTHPEFGKASPLRNPLQKRPEPSIFIPRPKPKPAPAKHSPQNPLYSTQAASPANCGASAADARSSKSFYLPGQRGPPPPAPAPSYSSALEAAQAFATQSQSSKRTFDPEFYKITPPTNAPLPAIPARAPPTFSSLGPKRFFQPFQAPKPVVDLTKDDGGEDDDDSFDPDAAIRAESGKFGAPDLDAYVDSAQANENIKNLLEGAFDDEEDRSNTRLRRRAKKTPKEGKEKESKSLAGKLQALSIKPEDASKPAPQEKQQEDEDEEDDGTVEGVTVKLLPHQISGVAWMIDKENGRPPPPANPNSTTRKRATPPPRAGILADDMGLGKTIQSLTLILTNPRPAPDAKPEYKGQKLPPPAAGKSTLVVAPLALLKQWADELKTRIAPSHALRVLVHHGPGRTKSPRELAKYDVVITTYQTLVAEHAPNSSGPQIGCMGVHWYRVILDEAHSIKNRSAKSTLACCALQSWFRWCLTGTPMQNNLDELYSLIRFLQIKPYCESERWKEGIILPMKRGRGGLAMRRLRVFLGVVMKRRTKDVLKGEGALGKKADGEEEGKGSGMKIVKREVVTVECDFDPEEQEFYLRLQSRADKRLREMRENEKNDYMGALVLLLRLRQACNHPRLIEMAVSKDQDALTTGVTGGGSRSASVNGTPRKGSKVEDVEMDMLAQMMGGVSVEAKVCDVCRVKLEKGSQGVRCVECEEDLMGLKKEEKEEQHKTGRKARNRRVVEDSDDEDGDSEGEWIGHGPEQHIDLGKAGGSEDEDAEGGGETLDSIDSERSADDGSDEEDSPPRAMNRRRQAVSKAEDLTSDNDDDDSGDDSDPSILANLPSTTAAHPNKPSTKIRRLIRILQKETPTHKTIVFSQFTSMLDLIEPHLRDRNLRFTRYDGSMRPDAREASLTALRTDPRCRILLCSLKCGSLGLNLTAASRVVIVEPFWNPFVEEQAIDRVHRLNQTVDVKVYRLTVRSTVEAEILNLQERKRELAAAAIEGSSKAGVGKLSLQDLLGLFRHDGVDYAADGVDEEDRAFTARFGGDHRLLDGPAGVAAAGAEQVGTYAGAGAGAGKKMARGREHEVFGRRW